MRILLSVLLMLALLPGYSGEARLSLLPPNLAIRAERVDLDPLAPARTRIGRLTYLGGVRLGSPAPGFGGFSAMAVDGDRFTLLSDGGNVVTFRMSADWQVRDARAFPLPDGPGTGWRKLDRDSESLAHDPATGRWWVGFERANQIWRFGDSLTRATGHAVPPRMRDWPRNGGAEAMVRRRDGSFIVLSESHRAGPRGVRQGLVFATDPIDRPRAAVAFGYRPPVGFRPTDIAELPDGRLVVVNRRAAIGTGFTASLMLLEPDAIRRGRIATGVEIARLEAPVLHDNFEAIAAVREGKDTILWIASDDNESVFQRSLLLKFRLDSPDERHERRTARIP